MKEHKTLTSLLALIFSAAFGYADALTTGLLPSILFAIAILLWAISQWDYTE